MPELIPYEGYIISVGCPIEVYTTTQGGLPDKCIGARFKDVQDAKHFCQSPLTRGFYPVKG